ncbi:MarR family winged helix-turn-helix transcriptional regulator [Kibdelosporangium aridum]|uniref:DNA-binding transcriptional regulator, MarR family n=2 Tax=Kibdelosporangium aridum TaxID=2030 RepID=A0A1Y5Y8F3_KIBAR|nr:MarR family transcriptional regulator [Kibdelosporangium aridum]SMD25623.1 DNA-binding transcriptional regulator, MarR family [Kibdelosporangium aridum]
MAGSTNKTANAAWEALMTAYATLMRDFAAQDIWQEASMREYDVLYSLSKCPEPLRIGELHKHLLLSQPALSRMVDRLVQRGFVERLAAPEDGRGVRLALTDTGRKVQQDIGRKHARDVARAVTARVNAEELRQLEAICKKLAGES